MVSLKRTIPQRPKSRSRGIALEIRCRANVLPFKSLLYAIAHANKYVIKQRNSNASLYAHRLSTQMRDISSTVNSLRAATAISPSESLARGGNQDSPDMNPDSNSGRIRSAINTYVELFYNISKEERKSYIESFGSGRKTKIKPERNLLIVPALMAELKLPKEEVSNGLFHSLYKMPFKVLYDSSKSALHVALLEQNMAIRTVPYDTVESFSKSMEKLESRMKEVDGGRVEPQEDEEIKADFIEKAMEFSKVTEINIIDLISERVGTEGAIRTRMHRLVRRGRY